MLPVQAQEARSYVSEAFRLVFPSSYRRRVLLMLRAYFDMSMSPPQTPTRVMCLAGYAAPLTDWERFEHRWRRLIKQAGLEFFHMTDFMSGHAAPYRDWSAPKRDRVLGHLVAAITEHVESGIVSVLYRDAYEQMPEEVRATYFRSEYRLCATGCIAAAADALIRSGSKESIAYVFELGDEGSGRCVQIINELLSRDAGYSNRSRVLSAHLENKRNAVALQAADMLAFVVRRAAQFYELPDTRLLPLTQVMPIAYQKIDGVNLKRITDDLGSQALSESREALRKLFVRKQRRRHRHG